MVRDDPSNNQSQWHVLPDSPTDDSLPLDEGVALIITAADRVWQDLYVQKKPVGYNKSVAIDIPKLTRRM